MSGCLREGPARQPAANNRPNGRRQWCFAWSSVLVLIVRVIVQELGRRKHRRRFDDPVVLAIDIGIEDRLMVSGDRFLQGSLLARHQIDAKLVGKHDQVAPGLMVTFDKLGHQLLDASLRHGHGLLPFTLLELYWLAERTLECRLQIRRHWLRLAFGTP